MTPRDEADERPSRSRRPDGQRAPRRRRRATGGPIGRGTSAATDDAGPQAGYAAPRTSASRTAAASPVRASSSTRSSCAGGLSAAGVGFRALVKTSTKSWAPLVEGRQAVLTRRRFSQRCVTILGRGLEASRCRSPAGSCADGAAGQHEGQHDGDHGDRRPARPRRPPAARTGSRSPTPNATSAAHSHMISTARRCEWPISSSRWCRCCLSGANGDRPARVRRTTASTRSSERHHQDRERQQQRQQGRRAGSRGAATPARWSIVGELAGEA